MNVDLPELNRVVAISDLHVPPAERLGSLEAGADLAKWTVELAQTASPDSALVLAGDTLDLLLIEDRPAVLNLATAALTIGETLLRVERERPWVARWRGALRLWGERGGQTILVPGNHDPEWYHPDSHHELARWIAPDPASAHPLTVWCEPEPWQCRVGPWHVMIAHGHRGDPMNDIDPAVIRRALRDGTARVPMPPGSELVVGPLQRFKRAMHPDGRRRFPFLDAVKPELPAVLLLLMYLDPGLLARTLPTTFAPLASMMIRYVRRGLLGGPVLVADPAADPSQRDDPTGGALEALAATLAAGLLAEIPEADRQAPEATLTRLASHLEGSSRAPSAWTLARHGGLTRAFLRAWLRRERQTSSGFFDLHQPSEADSRIIARHLPEGKDPRVVILGHTHAAREIRVDDHRVYLNTGTWTELLDLAAYDEQDESLQRLVDTLASGTLPAFRRLTWAEVTPAGPQLRNYAGS